MTGLYIHIPFCASRCIYCDFYSTTQLTRREAYVNAICQELEYAAPRNTSIGTIYIGGGTPSMLAPEQLRQILDTATRSLSVEADAEVTVEANPEDVTDEWVKALPPVVNRISLGVQTLDDKLLRILHRRHDAQQAVKAVRTLQVAGYDNISIDLMFGLPNQTLTGWQHDIDEALSLGVQHLSAYSLMLEPGTPLTRLVEQQQTDLPDEDSTLEMYKVLIDKTAAAGMGHYEISNFALPGHRSRHNSSYWANQPYIGIGAGAHGYDGQATRYANSADISKYIDYWSSHKGQMPRTTEHLDATDRYNEFIMCRMRTAEGVNLQQLREQYGQERHDYVVRMAAPHLTNGGLSEKDGCLRLTLNGLMVSNNIMSDFMLV